MYVAVPERHALSHILYAAATELGAPSTASVAGFTELCSLSGLALYSCGWAFVFSVSLLNVLKASMRV